MALLGSDRLRYIYPMLGVKARIGIMLAALSGFLTFIVVTKYGFRDSEPIPRDAQIYGTVYLPDGTPIDKASVAFDSHENPSPRRSAGIDDHQAVEVYTSWTGRGGVYWMKGLPPGQYHISARQYSFSANQVVGDRWFFPGTTNDSEAELVEIGAGKPKEIDIRFGQPSKPKFSFRVVTLAGGPVAQAEIGIWKASGENFRLFEIVRSQSDGSASYYGVESGDLFASVVRLPPQFVPVASQEQNGESSKFEVRVDHPTPYLIKVKEGQPYRGIFVWSEQAIAYLKHYPMDFYLDFEAGEMIVESVCDSSGFSTMGLLPEIEYRLRVIRSSPSRVYCPTKILRDGELLRGDDLRLPINGTVDEIKVEVALCARVLLTDYSSTAILVPVTDSELSVGLYSGPDNLIISDSSGSRNQFNSVPPGRYYLTDIQRRRLIDREIEVREGDGLLLSIKGYEN